MMTRKERVRRVKIEFPHVVRLPYDVSEIVFRPATDAYPARSKVAANINRRCEHLAVVLRPDILQWLRANVAKGDFRYGRHFAPSEENYVFRFRRVADAVHFKLRWYA
jgi:hypothetical protein